MNSLIDRGSDWLERYLMPPLGAVAGNIYLQSIRDAFIIFTLPLIIAGSLFLLWLRCYSHIRMRCFSRTSSLSA